MKTEILPVEVAHSPHVLSPPLTTPTEQKGQEAGLLAAIQKMKIANSGLNSQIDADKQKAVEVNTTSMTGSVASSQADPNAGLAENTVTRTHADSKPVVALDGTAKQDSESVELSNGDGQGPTEAA